ncbi:uncharacterized protein LOC117608392 [Osmia lignaria lignaria]|uniref:uncharacterized protein LOC117608392 n=1 Tax=Osmia lignaria lignaria TaxID=1437193 RepID=UPI0014781FA9|nr:uncharacterized protein LOC117608392 [Osmia lignaria]
MEEFQYVLQKQEKHKICFGSGCPRDTSKKGMNAFMKCYTLEDHPNVAPNLYNVLHSFKAVKTKPCSHSISRKGYSGIARFDNKIMLKDTNPSPLDYNIFRFPKQVTKSKYPFNSSSKRQRIFGSSVPGPGMYVSIKEQDNKFEHSFGGKTKMKLGVDLKCCSKNTDICKVCNKKLLGDYWHLKNKIFLCKLCMNKEYERQTKYKRKELKQFRKIRDCSNIHRHENTTAKIWLMHPTVIAKWIRREAYLSTYLKG